MATANQFMAVCSSILADADAGKAPDVLTHRHGPCIRGNPPLRQNARQTSGSFRGVLECLSGFDSDTHGGLLETGGVVVFPTAVTKQLPPPLP